MDTSTSAPKPSRDDDRTAVPARTFILPGNEIGVLLIHGFAGSLADLRPFGERLHTANGYTVCGVRLAGHGMTVADLDRSTPDDWYASVRTAYVEMARTTRVVVVIGESMGALMALRLSGEYPVITGVVCMSPAFSVHNELLRSVAMRITRPGTQWKKSWVDDARADRGSLRAVTSRSYRAFTRVMVEERTRTQPIRVPVLALFAQGDFVADNRGREYLRRIVPNELLTLIMVSSPKTHHLSEIEDLTPVVTALTQFIQRTCGL